MSYPINPPACPYMLRSWLIDATWLGSGMWLSPTAGQQWFFWEPPWRNSDAPNDWLVGPYRSLRGAARALKRFVDREADGPELRVWAP